MLRPVVASRKKIQQGCSDQAVVVACALLAIAAIFAASNFRPRPTRTLRLLQERGRQATTLAHLLDLHKVADTHRNNAEARVQADSRRPAEGGGAPLRHPLLVPARNASAASKPDFFRLNKRPTVGHQPYSKGSTRGTFPMFVHARNECIISESILMGGWEPQLTSWMVQAVKALPAEYMMDVGANIGVFSLAAAEAGADTLSFEPMAYNTELLSASAGTFARRGTINLFKTAVSANPNAKPVCIVRNGWKRKTNRANSNQGNGKISNDTTTCDLGWESSELVQINTIDNVLGAAFAGRPAPCVGALKIDVEGFEEPAIRGASSVMNGSCPPCHVQLEYGHLQLQKALRDAGRDFIDPNKVLLDALVDDLGYSCYFFWQRSRRPDVLLEPRKRTNAGLEGWADGDWVCRMEDYEKHPRCRRLPALRVR